MTFENTESERSTVKIACQKQVVHWLKRTAFCELLLLLCTVYARPTTRLTIGMYVHAGVNVGMVRKQQLLTVCDDDDDDQFHVVYVFSSFKGMWYYILK